MEFLLSLFRIELLMVFILNAVANALSTLKYVFISNENNFGKYFVTVIDSIMFIMIIDSIAVSMSFQLVVMYVLGRIFGLIVADMFVKYIDKPIYLVNLYSTNHIEEIQDWIIKNGISSTLLNGEFGNKERKMFTMHLRKTQLNSLREYLKNIGIDNPTMDISSNIKVSGRIVDRL